MCVVTLSVDRSITKIYSLLPITRHNFALNVPKSYKIQNEYVNAVCNLGHIFKHFDQPDTGGAVTYSIPELQDEPCASVELPGFLLESIMCLDEWEHLGASNI